ncbi:MAG: hypothetical protein ACQET5_06520 [Halobacteriota archaeon]|uniref:hypothetical protein n=1 Tax=Natronomonas sp. TaxID=2184060 RepID=UPI0039747808
MVGSRTLTALAGLLASLAVSVLFYVYTGSFLFFLFVPFVPFLFASRGSDDAASERPPIRECSRCDFATRNPTFEYCPRDGSRLYER